MTNYGKTYSSERPQEIEITSSYVFVASNIQPYTTTVEGQEVTGYEFDYTSYTKDEFLLQQNSKIDLLGQELQAAKILLGVD